MKVAKKIDSFALIVGAMKCGTTSLYNYLIQHPEIAACRYKEPHFFGKKSNLEKGFEYYQNLWNWNRKNYRIALEASTSYTGFKSIPIEGNVNSAKAIARFQADYELNFKFIYLMRNPIERLESHYNHLKANQYRHRKITRSKLNMMIESSKYAMQIDEYVSIFPQKNILLLNFDKLKQEPAKLIKEVCEFLEVDSQYNFQGLQVNHNSHKNRQEVIIPGWQSIRKNELVSSVIISIPKEVKHLMRNLLSRQQKAKYIKFSLEEKEYIVKQLKSDLLKLKYDHEFNFSSWNIEL